ncbi:hypothetical protein [Blastochloris viridis]|uniref:Uncharacterized protein n=1 Tax=Blastochloris viridis TaxID=1079 RepID=A0A0H5BFA2_BLAVI|nr:hypothetical protein [Blastochloris viridis]ALK09248.1 hypothetical protein BVIR_1465 [Blastochloris viridis]BAS00881.1 hypothetical protein BV133_3287 [Blastochloris viridis]CUU41911.1 hypothetical protein BVIRIDIS_09100 [Blastochloris viridis]
MAHPQPNPELHRRAFVLGLIAVGAVGSLAVTTGAADAAPALPVPPEIPTTPAYDALFRPEADEAATETVQWGRRCWINRWGQRVCRGGPPPWRRPRRRVCWWRNGRRYCAWR